jgi:predicted transcriptional regulator
MKNQISPFRPTLVYAQLARERVAIFELLINQNGVLKTSNITASLNTSDKTAKRTMAEFISMGLIELKTENYEKTRTEGRFQLVSQ